jgi:hypothetical protein
MHNIVTFKCTTDKNKIKNFKLFIFSNYYGIFTLNKNNQYFVQIFILYLYVILKYDKHSQNSVTIYFLIYDFLNKTSKGILNKV